jgi:NitT/TauT family transport system substrate-binding protein
MTFYDRFSSSVAIRAVVLAACLGAAGPASAETTVTLVQMHPTVGVGEEVFMYAVPKHLGYFKAEGLDVQMQQASGGGSAAQLIQNGSANFGTSMPESVLQTNEQGGDVVAIYNLKRDNGSKLVVLKDSPIQSLSDLKGKTIGGMSFASGSGLALRDSLTQMGFTTDQYTTVVSGVGPSAITAMDNKRLDGIVVWDALIAAHENAGAKLRLIDIPTADKMGGMMIAARRDYADAHPEVVSGFCRAVAKGLQYTLANPEAAIKIFWDEFPSTKPSGIDTATALRNHTHVMDFWFHFAELGLPAGEMPGQFLEDSWRFSAEAYQHAGVLKNNRPVTTGFTTKFLPECNKFDRQAVIDAAKAAN